MVQRPACPRQRNDISNLELVQERSLHGYIAIDEVSKAGCSGAAGHDVDYDVEEEITDKEDGREDVAVAVIATQLEREKRDSGSY